MLLGYKLTVLLSLLGLMMIQIVSAHADMVSTGDVLHSADRSQIVQMLERQDVKQQMIKLGVDPASARARVYQMTDTEISQINGRLEELPVGAGVGSVELLLIIIIILLLV